jgi:hypothetical protein
MIYIAQTTAYIFINLYERGESLTSTVTYDLIFTNQATKKTTTISAQATAITERYFQFALSSGLDSEPDGFYELNVYNGSDLLYSELVYLNDKTDVTHNSNDITTIYNVNEPS